MFARERPCRSGLRPTFVATTTEARLPRAANHLPSIASDSPPTLPGANAEYESALSTKLPPAST